MYFPSHIAAGLVIGKITGDYTFALIGSLAPDIDHFYAYLKHGIFKSWKNIVMVATREDDPFNDERNVFHNIIIAAVAWAVFMFVDLSLGLVFGIAYLSHIVMDAIDSADYFPLYPSTKINLKGPIGYFSKYDMATSIFLVIVFVALSIY